MNNVTGGEKRAVDAVCDAVRPLGLPVERLLSPHGPVVAIRSQGHTYHLAPRWAGEGFPDDVRRALDRCRSMPPSSAMPVVAAHYLSAGGRTAAEAADAGWADEAGNARIVASPGLAVLRTGGGATKRSTSGWSSSASAVAELILTQRARGEAPDDIPPIAMIAARLDWSIGQVAKVLAFFDREGWTEKRGGERGPTAVRTLVDPAGLLSGWAASHAAREVDRRGFAPYFREPVAFVTDRLASLLPPRTWCVTGWVALEMLAPFTTSLPSIDVYVDEDAFPAAAGELAEVEGFRPVGEGARLNLLRAPRHVVVLASSAPPFPLASPVRVYGDLLRLGARGEHAADRLREAVLGF